MRARTARDGTCRVARIRSIKPELVEDDVSLALSDGAWRLWVSMWGCLSDDFGNLRGSAGYLAIAVYRDPAREADVDRLLLELQRAGRCDDKPGLVVVYEHRGQRYVHITGFRKNQRIDNAKSSRVPKHDEEGSRTLPDLEVPKVSEGFGRIPLDLDRDLDLDGKGRDGKGKKTHAPASPERSLTASVVEPVADGTDLRVVSTPALKRNRKPVIEQAGVVGDLARSWSEAYASGESSKPIPTWGGEAAALVRLAKDEHEKPDHPGLSGEDVVRGAFDRYLACGEQFFAGHPLTKFVNRGNYDRFRMEFLGLRSKQALLAPRTPMDSLSAKGRKSAEAAMRWAERQERR